MDLYKTYYPKLLWSSNLQISFTQEHSCPIDTHLYCGLIIQREVRILYLVAPLEFMQEQKEVTLQSSSEAQDR